MSVNTNVVSSEAVKKPTNSKKIAFAISAVVSAIVISLSIVLVSTSWTSYGEAKTEVTSAENEYSSANSALTIANNYYDDAYAAYASWLSCYLTTNWRFSWMCGSGSSYSSDVDIAESLVSAAEADLKQARSRVDSANSDLDKAAKQFNQNVWIWGTVSALSLAALITFGTMQIRRNKVQRKTEELEARPDWDCPECSTHNEGGMFCIGCGFSKSDIKPDQVVEPKELNVEEPVLEQAQENTSGEKKAKAKPKAKPEPKE